MTGVRPADDRPTAPTHLPLRFGVFRRAAFGAAVLERRRSCALTQESLAVLAGLSPTEVAEIEEQQLIPSLDAVWALADALWVDAADLLHNTRRLAERMAVEAHKLPRLNS